MVGNAKRFKLNLLYDEGFACLMLIIKPTTRFQKDVKRAQRRGYDMSLLTDVIRKLASGETLPAKIGIMSTAPC